MQCQIFSVHSQQMPGAEVNAFAFCALQKALDEGYLGTETFGLYDFFMSLNLMAELYGEPQVFLRFCVC